MTTRRLLANDGVETSSIKEYETWGGNRKEGWVTLLPVSWVPFIQLTRLNPPIPVLLVYLPHLFGIVLAAILGQHPIKEVLRACTLLSGGSVFFSNAAHAWNDLMDAPLDELIERTRHRPIPRKAISKAAALIFVFIQATIALLFFYGFPYPESPLYAIPSVVAATYYPLAKRHSNFPQLVLGFCLSWGVFIGALAMGMRPFELSLTPNPNSSLICLFFASTAWVVIYDTVYAHMDLHQDITLGIGSTAVLSRKWPKLFLSMALLLMLAALYLTGIFGHLSLMFTLVAVLGSLLALGSMIVYVDLNSPASISWWFSNSFWYAGGSITGGLLLGYL